MTQQAPSASGAISWVVINTHPHKERFAVENLNRLQFIGYCPMLIKRIRHARRAELVLRPMFPAHVFAGVHVNGRGWRSILSTPGVRTIMCSGELPGFLRAGFVEVLRACEAGGRVVAPGTSDRTGQPTTEHHTGYSSLITALVEKSEDDRVLALIDLLRPPGRHEWGQGRARVRG
jgi:transcriptional antiterminator RfaH